MDPQPKYPFKVDRSTLGPRNVAWEVFSRLFVKRVNPFMCVAPKGFKQELQESFGVLSTNYKRMYVIFECDYICEKFEPSMFERLMLNKAVIVDMLVKISVMFPGSANSLTIDESTLLSAALGLDSVSKMIPTKLESNAPWM